MPAELLAPEWASRPLEPTLADYRANGFAVLPRVATSDALAALRARADAIMDGHVDPGPFFFQHDPVPPDSAAREGWRGPSRAYRKIEKLERDPIFRAWLANPLFGRIADALGLARPILLYRAILMNKAPRAPDGSGGGTAIPWHQDGGALWGLSRDPELQLWTALDDAPPEAGGLVVAAGSQRAGLASPLGGLVPAALAEHAPRATPVPVQAGDVVLVHNLAWHASACNQTNAPRRGFSVCFLDGRTRCTRTRRAPRRFERIFP